MSVGKLVSVAEQGKCGYCRWKDGDQYLGFLGMEWRDRGRNLGLLAAYGMFNLLVMILVFWWKGRGWRGRGAVERDAVRKVGWKGHV